MNENKKKVSTGKAIAAILLAIVILIVAQSLASMLGSIPVMIGAPEAVGNVIAGILYPILTFFGVKFLSTKILKLPLEECRISKFSVKPLWCIAAVVMPCLVSVILLLTTGHWENNQLSITEIAGIVTAGVFFYGLGAGFVEEMIFRGVIMSALEYRCNKYVAIIAPSVLFALVHIIGNDLDFLSIIQLIIAGSIVGILFSLVTYESGNVWNSAILHAVWNIIIVGGVLHIGNAADEFAIYNYVLDTDSFLLTGGAFGIESSVVSIAVYLIFIILAGVLVKKRK